MEYKLPTSTPAWYTIQAALEQRTSSFDELKENFIYQFSSEAANSEVPGIHILSSRNSAQALQH